MEKHILLVDDEEVSNFLAKKLIERVKQNCHIDSVNNGDQALGFINVSYASNLPLPDFIFLDLNMPILDGFGFLQAFNQLTIPLKEKIQIIVVSSSLDHKDSVRAKELGAAKFMSKPLNSQLIQELLS